MIRPMLCGCAAAAFVAAAIPAQSGAAPHDSTAETAAAATDRCGRNAASPRRRVAKCSGTAPGLFNMKTQTLTGDWGGARSDLAAHGIVPTLSYTAQPMVSDVSITGGRGWSWADQTNIGIAFDLAKLARLRGLQFYIDAAWGGGPILATDIGDLYGPQSNAAGPGFWVGSFYLQQTLSDGALVIAIGRMNSAGSFAELPVGAHYLNEFIAYQNPFALYVNDVGFTAFPPGVQWAAQGVYTFSPAWELGLSVNNNNPNSSAGSDHGFRWTLQQGNHGVLLNAQVNHFVQVDGLPGIYALGAMYDGNGFATLADSASRTDGMMSVYVQAQQRLSRPGGAHSKRGVTVWTALSYTARQSVSEMPFSASGGLTWGGPFAARASDVAAAGCAYGLISKSVPNATAETVCEMNYDLALAGWLSFTADFQHVWRPAGTSTPISGATILGFQLEVVF